MTLKLLYNGIKNLLVILLHSDRDGLFQLRMVTESLKIQFNTVISFIYSRC
jgi:hypothetical protein